VKNFWLGIWSTGAFYSKQIMFHLGRDMGQRTEVEMGQRTEVEMGQRTEVEIGA
jgi:hypothetical protein